MSGAVELHDDVRDALPRRERSRTVARLVGALLAVVMAVGIFAGLQRTPEHLDADTPEGIVQGYLQAVLDGDWRAAEGFLTEGLAERCTLADLTRSFVPGGMTATLDDTEVDGDLAVVRVRLLEPATPDVLGGGAEGATEAFELQIEQDGWRITGEPWPVYACRR